MGYTDGKGRWHSEFLTNAELSDHALPADPAQLAETFDPTIWGEDAGRAAAERLLASSGPLPESLTLLRTCLHIQSRIVRVATQDDDALDEVALLNSLADAVRERVTAGPVDSEATVVARQLTGGQPIAAAIYEDPSSREPRSLLIGLVTQPTTALRHPLENQLSEIVAFLVDRDEAFARGLLDLCAGDLDTQLQDAVAGASAIGARTQISLPAPGPGGLPQRTTLFPDVSIEGSDQAFQVLLEVKVEAALHHTNIAGVVFEQPDAYAHAWRLLAEPGPAKTRRVCTLTRERLADTGSDPWRRNSVTWREVAELLDNSTGVAIDAQLKLIATELMTLINTIVYPPTIDPQLLAYVQQIGPAVLEGLASELIGQRPDMVTSGTRSHSEYVGRYLTVPIADRELRFWLYATPRDGRYNTPGRDLSIVLAIADEQSTDWSREKVETIAGTLGLKLERDIAGYRLFRQFLPFPPDLDSHQAADHGRLLASNITASFDATLTV